MDRLISEKAVLEAFRKYQGSISDFYKAIKDMPSAEPIYYPPCEDCHKKMNEIRKAYDEIQSAEPKTGHWIEHPEIETSTPEYLMFYECSECGDKQCFCKSDIQKKHFCNNCGARMVEPQESEMKNEKAN